MVSKDTQRIIIVNSLDSFILYAIPNVVISVKLEGGYINIQCNHTNIIQSKF